MATGCLILELNPVKSPLAIDGVSQGNRIQSRTSPASNSGNNSEPSKHVFRLGAFGGMRRQTIWRLLPSGELT